jgi:hypothetical protein
MIEPELTALRFESVLVNKPAATSTSRADASCAAIRTVVAPPKR